MQHILVVLLLLFVSPLLGKIYWGVWDPEFTKENLSLNKVENDVGRKPSIVMTYLTVGDNLAPTRLNAIRSQGAIPMVTVEPHGKGELAAIANGARDPWIKRFAEDIKKWDHPIFVRFAHEMNGNWYAWSQEFYPDGTYKRAWNHFFQQLNVHKAVTVTSVWCPSAENDLKKGPDDKSATITSTFESVWPGPDNVDWLCLDGYSKNQNKMSFSQVFTPSIKHLNRIASGKPIMIGETGVTERADPDYKAEWIKQAFLDIPDMDIQAFLWFNENKKDSNVEYETSPAAKAAFRKGINNGFFTAAQFSNLNVNTIPTFEKIPAKALAIAADEVSASQPEQTLLGLPVGAGVGVIVAIVVAAVFVVAIVVVVIITRQPKTKETV